MSDNNGAGIVKGAFIGFTLGFMAGAVTALLLTTKTGEELRSDIRRIAKEAVNKVEEKAGMVKNMTKDKYNEIVNSVVSGYKKLKDLTEREIEFIQKVINEQKDIAK
ncbi:MAG: hypothetical protein A2Z35_00480 [Actinobacteria bacterium RBG_19FT_COMBO_36_27]|nr:MAG: hypothetical protein A2Z35_00480 [Actinobacteria bacterium RBG_19FT_COMBO_36_27]